MIPEIRKIKMILSQLEADIEIIVEQGRLFQEENKKLREELERLNNKEKNTNIN